MHGSLGTHQNTSVVPGLPYCPWLETLQTPDMEAALGCAVAELLIGLNFQIKCYEQISGNAYLTAAITVLANGY